MEQVLLSPVISYAKTLTAASAGGVIIDSLGREWDPLKHPRGRDGKFIRTWKRVKAFLSPTGSMAWGTGTVEAINPDGSIRVRINKVTDSAYNVYLNRLTDLPSNTVESINEKAVIKTAPGQPDMPKLGKYAFDTPEFVDFANKAGFDDYDAGEADHVVATIRSGGDAKEYGSRPKYLAALYAKHLSGEGKQFSDSDFMAFLDDLEVDPSVTDDTPDGMSGLKVLADDYNAHKVGHEWEDVPPIGDNVIRSLRNIVSGEQVDHLSDGQKQTKAKIPDAAPEADGPELVQTGENDWNVKLDGKYVAYIKKMNDLYHAYTWEGGPLGTYNDEESAKKAIVDNDVMAASVTDIDNGLDPITQSEIFAVKVYTGAEEADGEHQPHQAINAALRKDTMPNGATLVAAINGLDSLLSRSRTTKALTVYRGIGRRPDEEEAYDNLVAQLVDGAVISDKGFVSTSKGESTGKFFASMGGSHEKLVFKINVPEGAHAYDLAHNDETDFGENEVLLPRGSKFRVVGGIIEEDGHKVVSLELVPEGDENDGAAKAELPGDGDQVDGPSGPSDVDAGPDLGDAAGGDGGGDLPDAPAAGDEPHGIIPVDATEWEPGKTTHTGSNQGGVYLSPDGKQHYVKKGKTGHHAKNEALAAALYKEAGVYTAEQNLAYTPFGGALGTESPMIPGATQDLSAHLNDPEYLSKIHKGFVVDAWLGNYDVAGLVFDNIVSDENGNPVRVDPGGALWFRAQGKNKSLTPQSGPVFLDDVTDLDTMRDPSINPNTYKLFKGMSYEDELEGAKRVVAITPEKIDELVDSMNFEADADEVSGAYKAIDPELLKARLKKRREYIANKYNLPLPESMKGEVTDSIEQVLEELDELGIGVESLKEAIDNDEYTLAQTVDFIDELLDKLDNLLPGGGGENVNVPGYQKALKDFRAQLYEQLDEKDQPDGKKFEILDDPGTSGDGYHENTTGDGKKLWGKYGAAGVLVRHVDADGNEFFLLVQRGPGVSSNKGKWQLPGGALNSNENDYQGTARELWEELQSPDGWLDGLQSKGEVRYDHPSGWHYTNIAADAPEMFTPTVDGTETGDAKWFSKAEIADLDLHPALAENLDNIFGKFDGDTDAPDEENNIGSTVQDAVAALEMGVGEDGDTWQLPNNYLLAILKKTDPDDQWGIETPYLELINNETGLKVKEWSAEGILDADELRNEIAELIEAPNEPVEDPWATPEKKSVSHDVTQLFNKFMNLVDDQTLEDMSNLGAGKAVDEAEKFIEYIADVEDGEKEFHPPTAVNMINSVAENLNVETDTPSATKYLDSLAKSLTELADGIDTSDGDEFDGLDLDKNYNLVVTDVEMNKLEYDESVQNYADDAGVSVVDDSAEEGGYWVAVEGKPQNLKAFWESISSHNFDVHSLENLDGSNPWAPSAPALSDEEKYQQSLEYEATTIPKAIKAFEDVIAANYYDWDSHEAVRSFLYQVTIASSNMYGGKKDDDQLIVAVKGQLVKLTVAQARDIVRPQAMFSKYGGLTFDVDKTVDVLMRGVAGELIELDTPHFESLREYVKPKHSINKELRGDGPLSPETQKHVDNLDDLVNGNTVPAQTVYRGLNPADGDETTQAYIDSLVPGAVVPDKGFTSTSKSASYVKDFVKGIKGQGAKKGVLIEIDLPEGQHALDVDKTTLQVGEGEILLPRNTSLEIIGKTTDDDGNIIVKAKVVANAPEPAPDLTPNEPGPDSTDWQNMVDEQGAYRWGANGQKLRVGDKVKSLNDGLEGTIVKFETNHKGIVVKSDIDGKKKARKNDTLTLLNPPAPEPEQSDAPKNILDGDKPWQTLFSSDFDHLQYEDGNSSFALEALAEMLDDGELADARVQAVDIRSNWKSAADELNHYGQTYSAEEHYEGITHLDALIAELDEQLAPPPPPEPGPGTNVPDALFNAPNSVIMDATDYIITNYGTHEDPYGAWLKDVLPSIAEDVNNGTMTPAKADDLVSEIGHYYANELDAKHDPDLTTELFDLANLYHALDVDGWTPNVPEPDATPEDNKAPTTEPLASWEKELLGLIKTTSGENKPDFESKVDALLNDKEMEVFFTDFNWRLYWGNDHHLLLRDGDDGAIISAWPAEMPADDIKWAVWKALHPGDTTPPPNSSEEWTDQSVASDTDLMPVVLDLADKSLSGHAKAGAKIQMQHEPYGLHLSTAMDGSSAHIVLTSNDSGEFLNEWEAVYVLDHPSDWLEDMNATIAGHQLHALNNPYVTPNAALGTHLDTLSPGGSLVDILENYNWHLYDDGAYIKLPNDHKLVYSQEPSGYAQFKLVDPDGNIITTFSEDEHNFSDIEWSIQQYINPATSQPGGVKYDIVDKLPLTGKASNWLDAYSSGVLKEGDYISLPHHYELKFQEDSWVLYGYDGKIKGQWLVSGVTPYQLNKYIKKVLDDNEHQKMGAVSSGPDFQNTSTFASTLSLLMNDAHAGMYPDMGYINLPGDWMLQWEEAGGNWVLYSPDAEPYYSFNNSWTSPDTAASEIKQLMGLGPSGNASSSLGPGYADLPDGWVPLYRNADDEVYVVQSPDGKFHYFYSSGVTGQSDFTDTHAWDAVSDYWKKVDSNQKYVQSDLADIRKQIPKTYGAIIQQHSGIGAHQAKQYRNAGYALDDAMKEEVGSNAWNKAIDKAIYNLEQAGTYGADMLAKVKKYKADVTGADDDNNVDNPMPDNYKAPKPGATVVSKYDDPFTNTQYLVKNADGTYDVHFGDGAVNYDVADYFVNGDYWEPINPADTSNDLTLPAGYAKPKPDGKIIATGTYQGKTVYLVENTDGSRDIFYHDGSSNKDAHQTLIDAASDTPWQPINVPGDPDVPTGAHVTMGGSGTWEKLDNGWWQHIANGVKVGPTSQTADALNQTYKDAQVSGAPSGSSTKYLGDTWHKNGEGNWISDDGQISVPPGTSTYDKLEEAFKNKPPHPLGDANYSDLPDNATPMFKHKTLDGVYAVKHADGSYYYYKPEGGVQAVVATDKQFVKSDNWELIGPDPGIQPDVPWTPKQSVYKTGGDGKVMYMGDKVFHTSMGINGTVTGFESGDKPGVKVWSPDTGKTHIFHKNKLISKMSYAEKPGNTDVTPEPPTPTMAPKSTPKATFEPVNPDPSSPWFGKEKPKPPVQDVDTPKFVDEAWMKTADANYKKRMKSMNSNWTEKDLEHSSTYHHYTNVRDSGSMSDLDLLLSKGRITQEMYDDAKAQIQANAAKVQAAQDAFKAKVDAWKADMKAWSAANGMPHIQLKGMDDGVKKLNNQDAKKLVDSLAAHPGTPSYPGGLNPTGKLTKAAENAVYSQKSSNISHIPREILKWKVFEPGGYEQYKIDHPEHAAAVDKLLALRKGMEDTAPLTEDILVIRTFDTHAFKDPLTGNYLSAGADISHLAGSIQGDFGFAETTPGALSAGGQPGLDVGGGGGIVMQLRVPAGITGIWTRADGYSFNTHHSGEKGFILEDGIFYYIHKVEYKHGKWYVDAEVIPKEYYDQFGNFQNVNPFFD